MRSNLLAEPAPDEGFDLLQRAECIESLGTAAIQAEDAKDVWLRRIVVHRFLSPDEDRVLCGLHLRSIVGVLIRRKPKCEKSEAASDDEGDPTH